MAGVGSAPGERKGGRKKGAPNKVTTGLREIVKAFSERNAERIEELWLRLAEEDPKAALDTYTKLLDFSLPRMQRHEVAGEGGRPIIFRIEESK